MKKFIYLLALAAVLSSPPVLAGVREDVLAAMQRCAVIPDDRTWLDCTYGAQQLMRSKLGLVPAPEFQQRLVPPATTMAPPPPTAVSAVPRATPPARNSGGVMSLFSGHSQAVTVSVLVGVRYDSQGAFIATLENGQVWHQVNVQPGYAKARLTLGSKITVVPGSIWSYDLKVGNSQHAYKVDPET